MPHDGPTFQGCKIEWAPGLAEASPRTYLFDPTAKVGPHTGIEFFEALAGPRASLRVMLIAPDAWPHLIHGPRRGPTLGIGRVVWEG